MTELEGLKLKVSKYQSLVRLYRFILLKTVVTFDDMVKKQSCLLDTETKVQQRRRHQKDFDTYISKIIHMDKMAEPRKAE